MRPSQARRHEWSSLGHLGSTLADRAHPDACARTAHPRGTPPLREPAMRALMYHDIVEAGASDSSGFAGRDAALYKVAPGLFDAHLDEILRSMARSAPPHGFEPTFDDGGVAAMT